MQQHCWGHSCPCRNNLNCVLHPCWFLYGKNQRRGMHNHKQGVKKASDASTSVDLLIMWCFALHNAANWRHTMIWQRSLWHNDDVLIKGESYLICKTMGIRQLLVMCNLFLKWGDGVSQLQLSICLTHWVTVKQMLLLFGNLIWLTFQSFQSGHLMKVVLLLQQTESLENGTWWT